jgi:glyoxylase-like metal-dependent hydrolase (beta-lactamase superfamily II)
MIAALFLAAAMAADAPKQFFTLHDLGSGVWAAVAVPGSGAGSNAGFVIGDDGVAVVDTFQSAGAATALLAAIRERTPLPIRYVVNTHYHLDHVAGNGVFHDAGATIIAQRNVRAWERTENLKFFGPNPPADKKAWVESLVLPDIVYDDALDLFLGSRRILVRSMPGHTGGDSVVTIPDASVVFTGDLFWNTTLPNTIDGDTAAWARTDEQLATINPKATFVPGHGEIGTAKDVVAFREYLQTLRDAVAAARQKNLSGDALTQAVRNDIAPRYDKWAFYSHFIDPNIRQMDEELAGTKRRPAVSQ